MQRYIVMYNTTDEVACCFTCMADSIDAAWDLFCTEVKTEVGTYLESVKESHDNPTLGEMIASFCEQKIMLRSYEGEEIRLGSQWLESLDRNLLLDRGFILRNEASDEYDLCITLC